MIKLFYTIVLFSYIKSICIEQKYYQSLKTSIHFASHAINAIDNNETSQLKLKENTIPEKTLETSSDKKEISKNEPETKLEDYDQFRKNKLKDIRREVDQASKIESLRNKLIEKKKNLESLKLDYELKNLKDQEEEIMARISQNKIFITRHIIRYEFLVNLNYLKMIDNGKKNRFGSKDYWKYKKKTTIGKGMKKNIEKFRTTKTNLLIELMSTREKITEIQNKNMNKLEEEIEEINRDIYTFETNTPLKTIEVSNVQQLEAINLLLEKIRLEEAIQSQYSEKSDEEENIE